MTTAPAINIKVRRGERLILAPRSGGGGGRCDWHAEGKENVGAVAALTTGAADDERGFAVPFLDDLQLDETRVVADGFGADADGFGFTLGLDDGGVGLDLRFLLREAGFGGFLFLDHLRFDGGFEFLREDDVFDDQILDDEQRADFFASGGESAGFDFFAFLDELLGALKRGYFFESFLNAGSDEAVEGIAGVFLVNANDGTLGDAIKETQVHVHLLKIGGVGLGGKLTRHLADGDVDNVGDEGSLGPEALGFEIVTDLAERDLNPAKARLDHVGALCRKNDEGQNDDPEADEFAEVWSHARMRREHAGSRKRRFGRWNLLQAFQRNAAPRRRVVAGSRFYGAMRQIVFDPSSLTRSAPSRATVTPTGRPQTSPFSVTKPVRKSSYSPVARPFSTGTMMTL